MWHIDFPPEQNYLDHQTGKKTRSHIETESGVCKSWNPKKERDCRLMENDSGKTKQKKQTKITSVKISAQSAQTRKKTKSIISP